MSRGQVRIIGGEWRGRKLGILDHADVRPTPDRVRVTLFNWLAALLPGACCLDLFAGTGVLGFECLSRGAREVVMIDQSAAVIELLAQELRIFKADNARVYQAKIPQYWPLLTQAFDIVFLDPPYRENLLLPACFALEERRLLANPAYIYLETGREMGEAEFPVNWTILKHKKAGQVNYYLVKRVSLGADLHETNHSNP